jgi:CBS domain containing-hemolysin-like protein
MIPRPRVITTPADEPLAELVERMAFGHSRYPVVDHGIDDVVGVICLRDVLELPSEELGRLRVRDVARTPTLLPDTLPLPQVLARLRGAGDELGCVLDEYGGFAGVITIEDIAEELVGEIGDEHDPAGAPEPERGAGPWTVDGSILVEEVERLIEHRLPRGDYHTVGGLVMAELGRLPDLGDAVTLTVPAPPDHQNDAGNEAGDGGGSVLGLTVRAVEHRVPARVELRWIDRGRQERS